MGKLDLCPGWYCLTPHSGLETKQYKGISKGPVSQSTKFLRGGEGAKPGLATGDQYGPGHRCRSIQVRIDTCQHRQKTAHIFYHLVCFASFTNKVLQMTNPSPTLFSLQRTTRCAPRQQEIATRGCHLPDRLCPLASPHHSSSQTACRQ